MMQGLDTLLEEQQEGVNELFPHLSSNVEQTTQDDTANISAVDKHLSQTIILEKTNSNPNNVSEENSMAFGTENDHSKLIMDVQVENKPKQNRETMANRSGTEMQRDDDI